MRGEREGQRGLPFCLFTAQMAARTRAGQTTASSLKTEASSGGTGCRVLSTWAIIHAFQGALEAELENGAAGIWTSTYLGCWHESLWQSTSLSKRIHSSFLNRCIWSSGKAFHSLFPPWYPQLWFWMRSSHCQSELCVGVKTHGRCSGHSRNIRVTQHQCLWELTASMPVAEI